MSFRIGDRDNERFWISLIVRFAFGFLFLIAALNIFTYYDTKDPPPDPDRGLIEYLGASLSHFETDLSVPYENTWLNFKWSGWPLEDDAETNQPVAIDLGMVGIRWFIWLMPFVFSLLALSLLTGLFYRCGLRCAAFYLVLLGLGKYVVGDSATTAQDFTYAAFILVGLFLSSRERTESGIADYSSDDT